jgi:hypothetical protein
MITVVQSTLDTIVLSGLEALYNSRTRCPNTLVYAQCCYDQIIPHQNHGFGVEIADVRRADVQEGQPSRQKDDIGELLGNFIKHRPVLTEATATLDQDLSLSTHCNISRDNRIASTMECLPSVLRT